MPIKDQPHFTLPAADLATWLDHQGGDSWWDVDGDPLLTGLITFPSPSDELSSTLRRIGKPLLLLDKHKRPGSKGQQINCTALDDLVDSGPAGVRLFQLSWADDKWSRDWLLTEDKETQKDILDAGVGSDSAAVKKS